MEHEPQTSGIRDFLTILFKHKYKIIIIFMAVVIPAIVISLLLPPVYEAKSSLIVKFGREYLYRPEVGDTRSTISFPSLNQEAAINAEIQILTSKDLIEKVIKVLGVDTLYPDIVKTPLKRITPLEAAIPRFEKSLSVTNIEKSNVIGVSFQHKDPKTAASAVNQLVEFYKEKHLQVLSNTKSSFLEKQLATYQQKLKESENSLEAFKQKHKVFSLDEQRSLLLQQRVDLDTSLKNIQNRIQELRQIFSSPEGEISKTFSDIPLDIAPEQYRIINDAKAKLLSLQLKEKELLTKYREDSEFVISIRKGIQEEMHLVKEFLREQEKNFAKTELGSLESQSAAIKQQLKKMDKEILALDLTEKELQISKREVAANEKNYETYLSKLEEARISEDMDRQKMANISVIQEAFVPVKPIKPRKTVNIVLGIIIGVFSGLGFAFFSEYLSQGLSTPESTERRLNLPVITSISYSHKNGKPKTSLLRWGLSTSATFLLIAGILWISPYKSLILSKGDQGTSEGLHTKTVTTETQKEASSLKEKVLISQSETSIPPEQEAPLKKVWKSFLLHFKPDNSATSEQEATIQVISTPSVSPAQKTSIQNDTNKFSWTINISSTISKGNAINLFDKLRKDGYNAYITKFKHKNKLWYRVRIGFFLSREDARKTGDSINKKYVLHNYWIARAPESEIRKHAGKKTY